jgi:thiol-disulfide isomerase/thioredoxin
MNNHLKYNKKYVFIFLFLLLGLGGGVPWEQASGWAQGLKAAPDFTLNDLSQKKIKLSNFKGKVVILNFFATWCPPCRAEIPELIKLYRLHKEKGLVILGVSLDMDVTPQELATFVRNSKITYPVLLGTTDLADKYQVNGVPTTIVINREGKTFKRHDGLVPSSNFEKDLGSIL